MVATKAEAGAVWSAVTTGPAGARRRRGGGCRPDLAGRPAPGHPGPQRAADRRAGRLGGRATPARASPSRCSTPASTPPTRTWPAGSPRRATSPRRPTPDDTVGHGTHVASTIAGSGAASGGKYRGVAPDATLLFGKVCENDGCTDSAILAGMQWAAVEQHAAVVNMSLGGGDTPEVDPLEEAVETLTAQTGTLFVIAAGNDGVDGSVGSPGTADAALTVGAVDRDDELADFSSRGPRVGDDGAQAGHHRARRRTSSPPAPPTATRRPGGGRVRHPLRHLDGHPARRRRGGAARPAAPGLDGRAAQGAR